MIKVTPDPGVIEVNIAPARSWAELRDNAIALYEEARESRLTTEKFLIDGREVYDRCAGYVQFHRRAAAARHC